MTFLFAGGGTGGHLYPGLAIAEEITRRDRAARCLFVCSTRPLDAEILSKESLNGERVRFEANPAQPFGLRPRSFLRFVSSWGKAVRAGRGSIQAARGAGSVHVVAMGGFVAAPLAQAARVERVSITLVNLDAVPGRANRWIARHADRIFTAATVDSSVGTGWMLVPPIVRRAAMAQGTPAECRKTLGLEPQRPTLLVTGASQGARSINEFVAMLIERNAEVFLRAGWQVVHQTGKGGGEGAEEAYRRIGMRSVVREFIAEMGVAWGAADAALSRAGAGSVAEAWCNRVPTLFMPYPYHKDQHQRLNVARLVEAGAGIVCEDQVDRDSNINRNGAALLALVTDVEKRAAMREALIKLGPADGASRVAETLLASA